MNFNIRIDSIVTENINPTIIAKTITTQINGINMMHLHIKDKINKKSCEKSIAFLIFKYNLINSR